MCGSVYAVSYASVTRGPTGGSLRDSSLSLLPSFSSRLALLLQLSVMLSLSKIALFSLISFATLALAVPAPEPRSVNTRALFAGANVQIVNTMCPVGLSTCLSFSSPLLYAYGLRIAYVTPSNNTAANIGPILTEVTSIVNEFIIALKGSNLDCSVQEILELVADLIKVLLLIRITFPF